MEQNAQNINALHLQDEDLFVARLTAQTGGAVAGNGPTPGLSYLPRCVSQCEGYCNGKRC